MSANTHSTGGPTDPAKTAGSPATTTPNRFDEGDDDYTRRLSELLRLGAL